MYGHDGLNSPEKLILLEAVVQINRNKTCLPVMAVNNVRAEINYRKYGKHCLGEECKFLQIPRSTVIWLRSTEIILIIYKVELNAIILHLKNTYITVLVSKIHVEVCDIFHFIFPFLLHAGIFR